MPDHDNLLRILAEIDDSLTELLFQGRQLALTLSLRGYNPGQPRRPSGSPEGGQWTSDATGSQPSHGDPGGGDADNSRWHGFVAAPERERSPAANLPNAGLEDVAYRGAFHDQVRDQLANDLRAQGANVETEVALTLPTHPMSTAIIDLLVQNPKTGTVYGVEVKQARTQNSQTRNYWFTHTCSLANRSSHWINGLAGWA